MGTRHPRLRPILEDFRRPRVARGDGLQWRVPTHQSVPIGLWRQLSKPSPEPQSWRPRSRRSSDPAVPDPSDPAIRRSRSGDPGDPTASDPDDPATPPRRRTRASSWLSGHGSAGGTVVILCGTVGWGDAFLWLVCLFSVQFQTITDRGDRCDSHMHLQSARRRHTIPR